MSTLLYTHPAFLDHDTGEGHPERPARLQAVLASLAGEAFSGLDRREAPPASREQLARVHDGGYIDLLLRQIPDEGLLLVDADTVISPRSGEAALRAAGAVCAAVDAVVAGEGRSAFCAVRPPGHHAEPGRAMGFCLFNNVAVGALQARAVHGLRRIAVVDFDVHHGNGTQAMFGVDADLFYGSIHQSPLYPGTGAAAERGIAGNVLNLPLRAGAGSEEFRAAAREGLLPALEAFRPDLVMISAGFDGHAADPLAGLKLRTEDFRWITDELCQVAARHAEGRVVSTLEGGYDLRALADATAAHVGALMSAG